MTATLQLQPVTGVSTQLLIGSRWRAASSGDRFAVQDPDTGGVIAQVAVPDAEQPPP